MRISDTLLEQLNAQADLVAIIRRHTPLKPAGREFKGCCPFHGEKTPSFYVNPESNLYYCFGCGAKGNAISFLVDFERLSFIEAAKTLSEQTGIELPKEGNKQYQYQRGVSTPPPTAPEPPINTFDIESKNDKTPNTPLDTGAFDTSIDDTQEHTSADAVVVEETAFALPVTPFELQGNGDLYQLLTAVTAFYRHQLQQHPVAMSYFVNRGLSHDTINTFELGYAPAGWQHLESAFPNDIDGLRMLGLVRTSQKGREFDLLRDRVIFPIKDKQGRVVGFAGRALDDSVTPKYLNSSDSVVFQKQHILYGYYESRQARAKEWLIVEGYMDVIALYQAGIFGAVAPMGTAVNAGQLANLFKFNNALTLCFDGDSAGQRAALRTLEVAMPILVDGKQLNFLTLADSHDPDTFIKAFGDDAMRDAIAHALPLSDYLYQIMAQKYDLSRAEDKASAMAEVKLLTEKLPKGSSFRWWLNNDIYQRLRGKPVLRSSANYQHTNDAGFIQIFLCILYQPTLIADDPLTRLYQASGLDAAHLPLMERLTSQGLSIPELPTWSQLPLDGLSDFIDATLFALPHLICDK